ncbi:MAG: hypothetical protein NT081_07310 [Actinobacteria bacterium]|nr:hypothetical protein [Actinomycetota bacterium]
MIHIDSHQTSISNSAVSKRSKALKLLGVLALLSFVATVSLACSGGAAKSEGATTASSGSTSDGVTTSTVTSVGDVVTDQQTTPTSVSSAQGSQSKTGDSRNGTPTTQAARTIPNPQSPAPTSPPVITTPPTTAYVCVPNWDQISRLNSDFSYSQSQYSAAVGDLMRRGLGRSGMMVTLQATAADNQAEYNRALSALNSCQSTSWYFFSY